jgi:hypothetical protein
MSKTVRFKLYGKELDAAYKFSLDTGMPLDALAKAAFFYTIRKGYEKNEMDKGIPEGDTGAEESVRLSSDSDALQDQRNVDDSAAG